MGYVTIVYDEIKVRALRKLICERCGKKFNRQRTFTQTRSPFNKNPDGTVCTHREIRAKLEAISKAWEPRAVCTKCA